MEKKNYIVGIDIGSSNVVVVVGSKDGDGRINVEAIVSKPSRGVNAGMIENINLASDVLKEAKQEIEEELGIRITEAYAGISGSFVRCDRYTDHVFVKEPHEGITQRDVDSLSERMNNVVAPENETIMERVPQNYMVDGGQEIKSPVGSFGRQLSSTFNFILCDKKPLERLKMVFRHTGLQLAGVYANPLIMPEAVLTDEEKEDGVAVVDLGGGTTDVAVYHGNVVRYIASIPLGANAVNRDIATHGVPERSVEKLKKNYGSAIAEFVSEQKLIQIPSMGHRTKGVMRRNLAAIIEARLTDIAEYVKAEIKDSGYASRLPFGIVLTGGSASMEHIDELFRRVTGFEVRIATAEAGINDESREKIATPAHTAAVALLLTGARRGFCSVMQPAAKVVVPPPARSAAATYAPTAKPSAATEAAYGQPRSETPPADAGKSAEEETRRTEQEPQHSKNGLGGWLKHRFKKTTDTINTWFENGDDEEII